MFRSTLDCKFLLHLNILWFLFHLAFTVKLPTSPQMCAHSTWWMKIKQKVPTLLHTKKFRDFSVPQNVFPGLRRSPAMLNYRQTAVTYSVYTVWQYNELQNVYHKLQRNCSVSTEQEYFHTFIYTWCSIHKKAFRLSWITGKFQDIPGSNSFFRNFRSWKFYDKNLDFAGGVGTP